MGGISSGVGLISGINSKQLIDQLLQIEARPQQLAQQRVLELQQQQAAYLDINSTLLALKSAAGAFNTLSVFRASKATSSDTSVLNAVAANNASPGSFNISVSRLTTTHQAISRGFDNKDVSGIGATSLTVEVGGGRLDSETTLAELNGGQGVSRGKIKITDSSGASATVDLSKAVTVDDVIAAINSSATIDVTASIVNDRLQIKDDAGGSGAFAVEDVFGSSTATSLGVAASASAGAAISSAQSLLYLSASTPLSRLRDGNGVLIGPGGATGVADFKINLTDAGTPSNSHTYQVILGNKVDGGGVVTSPAVTTIGDLITRIQSETGGAVTASISADGRSIALHDATGDTNRTLSVQEGLTGTTAADLGLLGGTLAGSAGSQTLTSDRLIASINSTLTSNLGGGAGVGSGQFSVTRRDGTAFSVTIAKDSSVADVLSAINGAGGSTVKARLNDAGNGILVTDSTSGGNLVIADTTGTVAAGLKIATTGDSDGVVNSGNLQTRYISGAKRLAELNGGKGVGIGSFRVTDSAGKTALVNITASAKNVDDVVDAINALNPRLTIHARINDNGDGILIEDTAGGTQKLKIADESGTVAKTLHLAGESASATVGSNKIDGTNERVVAFSASDTLQSVVDKITSAGVGIDASIVNAGDSVNPYKIIFTSKTTGRVGRFVIESQGVDLNLQQLAKGQDAVAFFGAGNAADSVLLTSTTNTLDNVVSGVTIDLNGVSDQPVHVTVARDTAKVESTIQAMVAAYNAALDKLDKYDSYDPDTDKKGALLGDSTVGNVRNALLSQIQGSAIGVQGQFTRLFQVGVKIGAGSRLEFDSDRFRSALQDDPDGVADLFSAFSPVSKEPTVIASDADGHPLITTPNTSRTTYSKLGVAEQIKLLTTNLTSSVDGLLTGRRNTLDSQISFQNQRIADFQTQLDNKRTQLEKQFSDLEQTLANLQSQQSSLSSLTG